MGHVRRVSNGGTFVQEVGTSRRPDLALAIIVGAGGMGMAVARRLGQSHRILIADRDAEHLARQMAQLRTEGYDALSCACDVTSADSVSALARTAKANGPVQTLAHVVGLSPSMGDFRTIMAVNWVGANLVAEAFRPLLRSGGSAVFISSMAGHLRDFGSIHPVMESCLEPDFFARLEAAIEEPKSSDLAYLLSKAALNRMVQRKAAAWGKLGLRIVSLSPGLIATPMGALQFERQPLKYEMLAATPIPREGTMVEIADAVEFLTSAKASFISGIDLLVDGGLVAALRHAPGSSDVAKA